MTGLLAAFPSWGYLGEETGSKPGAEATWYVDPNDGTSAFLRGWRGSSVSIGLVHADRPVLGGVHSPLTPDDGGDLITWAEGEPLRRNGQTLAPPVLPGELTRDHVVAVSHAADRNPEANARCVAPASYRPLPSIAYRLALVAVGDVAAAVSLAAPTHWDLCAGEALLRAAGGVLARRGGYVVGGAPSVATQMVMAPWEQCLARG